MQDQVQCFLRLSVCVCGGVCMRVSQERVQRLLRLSAGADAQQQASSPFASLPSSRSLALPTSVVCVRASVLAYLVVCACACLLPACLPASLLVKRTQCVC